MKIVLDILKSLRPIFFILFILFVLAAVFFSYDQYNTYKENEIAASLTGNLLLNSDCKTIVNEGTKFDLKFTLENKNNEPVQIESLGIDQDFFGEAGRKYMDLVGTNPTSVKDGSQNRYSISNFPNVVEVAAKSKKDLSITMQARSRAEAEAEAATIMVYKGNVNFSLRHNISAEASCQIQVRYGK
jgi:hypothetical protein